MMLTSDHVNGSRHPRSSTGSHASDGGGRSAENPSSVTKAATAPQSVQGTYSVSEPGRVRVTKRTAPQSQRWTTVRHGV